MARYIDADKMLANICAECLDKGTDECKNGNCTERNWINNTQTEDVQPVKHGRWNELQFGVCFECSECGNMRNIPEPYCDQCGAKMHIEKESGNEI